MAEVVTPGQSLAVLVFCVACALAGDDKASQADPCTEPEDDQETVDGAVSVGVAEAGRA